MMRSALRMYVSHTRKYTDRKTLPIVKIRLDPKGSSSSVKFPIVPEIIIIKKYVTVIKLPIIFFVASVTRVLNPRFSGQWWANLYKTGYEKGIAAHKKQQFSKAVKKITDETLLQEETRMFHLLIFVYFSPNVSSKVSAK